MKLIPDRGAIDAKLVIIGEAPGRREFEEGAPFVGPSGWLLTSWMRKFGISQRSVYFTNVVQYWPGEFAPQGVKTELNNFRWLPKWVIEQEQRSLHTRLSLLRDPWLIVPTGNRALQAIGIEGKISDYRGSILSIENAGRTIKCIPTIHPAATFRRPILTRFCLADWKRIAADLQFRDLRIPSRSTVIASSSEVERFFNEATLVGRPIALDIECSTKDGHLQCLAAAYEPGHALCIPLELPGSHANRDPYLKQCWEWARRLCNRMVRPNSSSTLSSQQDSGYAAKVLQNGLFDQYILKQKGGIDLIDYEWDTMELDHLLFPNDGSDPQGDEEEIAGENIKLPMHGLSTLCSLYTRTPFYKGDARDGFKFGWDRYEDLWEYNGLDAMVTIEVFHVLREMAKERGLL